MRLRPFILCFNRTAFTVQKSGLKSLAFRPKSFSQISSKSYRHNAVPNRFSSRFSTSLTNGTRLLSQAKAGTPSAFGEESHTTAYTAKQGAFLPRPQRGLVLPAKSLQSTTFATLDSAVLLYTYISRFSVDPTISRREKVGKAATINFIHQPFLIPIFNFLHKRPPFAFTGENEYILAFLRKIAHNGSHAETGGLPFCDHSAAFYCQRDRSKQNDQKKRMHA